MYLLYIDEAGTTSLKKDGTPSPDGGNTLYFVLGAVLINARELEKIEDQFESIKKIYFKDSLTEIKFSIKANLMNPGTSISSYRKEAYQQIAQSSVTLFGVGQNKYSCYSDGLIKSKDDTYQLAFQNLVALINAHMFKNKIKDPITVFIDSINEAHDTKMFIAYKQALHNESLFPNFDKSIFSPSLNFAISKFTVGLQIADLVAGSLWRGLEAEDKTYSTIIKKRFPASDNGNPLNYGYKICSEWLIKK